MSSAATRDFACREMVELVTDYLEGQLGPVDHDAFEAHLAKCDGCSTYVEQMRQTLAALGRIPTETVSPQAREALLHVFDEFQRTERG